MNAPLVFGQRSVNRCMPRQYDPQRFSGLSRNGRSTSMLHLDLACLLVLLLLTAGPDISSGRLADRLAKLENSISHFHLSSAFQSYLFGIPSTSRGGANETLVPALKSLLAANFNFEFKIVVLLADMDSRERASRKANLQEVFPREFEDQKLIVVEVSDPFSVYHPALLTEGAGRCSLRRRHGDSLKRVLWRTKLASDLAFLWRAADELLSTYHLTYYVHLEDDVFLDRPAVFMDFHVKLGSFSQDNAVDFINLNPASHGRRKAGFDVFRPTNELPFSWGWMISRTLLKGAPPFLLKNIDVDPVDWLFGSYLVLVRAAKQAEPNSIWRFRTDMFGHHAPHSTGTGIDEPQSDCETVPTIEGPFVCWQQCDKFLKTEPDNCKGRASNSCKIAPELHLVS